MPIRPENKALYPANWKSEIVPAVRERSGNRCETCGVMHNEKIDRTVDGQFWRYSSARNVMFHVTGAHKHFVGGIGAFQWRSPVRVILTVAHLNHDPTDNRMVNLRHWCQLHHNQHDAAYRAENRKKNAKP